MDTIFLERTGRGEEEGGGATHSHPEQIVWPVTQHSGADVSQHPNVPLRRVAFGSIIASHVRFV